MDSYFYKLFISRLESEGISFINDPRVFPAITEAYKEFEKFFEREEKKLETSKGKENNNKFRDSERQWFRIYFFIKNCDLSRFGFISKKNNEDINEYSAAYEYFSILYIAKDIANKIQEIIECIRDYLESDESDILVDKNNIMKILTDKRDNPQNLVEDLLMKAFSYDIKPSEKDSDPHAEILTKLLGKKSSYMNLELNNRVEGVKQVLEQIKSIIKTVREKTEYQETRYDNLRDLHRDLKRDFESIGLINYIIKRRVSINKLKQEIPRKIQKYKELTVQNGSLLVKEYSNLFESIIKKDDVDLSELQILSFNIDKDISLLERIKKHQWQSENKEDKKICYRFFGFIIYINPETKEVYFEGNNKFTSYNLKECKMPSFKRILREHIQPTYLDEQKMRKYLSTLEVSLKDIIKGYIEVPLLSNKINNQLNNINSIQDLIKMEERSELSLLFSFIESLEEYGYKLHPTLQKNNATASMKQTIFEMIKSEYQKINMLPPNTDKVSTRSLENAIDLDYYVYSSIQNVYNCLDREQLRKISKVLQSQEKAETSSSYIKISRDLKKYSRKPDGSKYTDEEIFKFLQDKNNIRISEQTYADESPYSYKATPPTSREEHKEINRFLQGKGHIVLPEDTIGEYTYNHPTADEIEAEDTIGEYPYNHLTADEIETEIQKLTGKKR